VTPEVITDAELINKFAAQAQAGAVVEAPTKAPPSTEVHLPGGFMWNGELIKSAEVRELTGIDEEAISKAPSLGKSITTILERGLKKLGNKDATREDLDALLSGDRDAIFIGIRRVTLGDTIGFKTRCGNCAEEQDISIDLGEDIPVVELEESRSWKIETKKGYVEVALPTGVTQRKLLDNMDKKSAEINTLLLAGCVLSVNGEPSMGASTVLNFGMADRAKIIDEILQKNPGPRLGEVTKTCKACGEKIALPLGLADLFLL